MSEFLQKFGNKIRFYRELRNLTQEALAEKVDVSLNTVGLWENGKSFLEYPSLQKLCRALEVTEEDLFSFACTSDSKSDTPLSEINALSRQLTPTQQKQIIDIIKTFLKQG